MIKLKSLLNQQPIHECVIARMPLDGNTILAKNRDRMYAPELEVVHELVNGVEVVYMHDVLTDWSEGMNSNGIGVLNASLSVAFDEAEGDLAKDKAKKGKSGKPSYDGLKIRKALSASKLSQAVRSIISYRGEDRKDVGVKGMTIVSSAKFGFVIEMTSKHLPIITRIGKDETVTRTNHGHAYSDAGYTGGLKKASSKSREDISLQTLKGVEDSDEVLDTLSKQHVTDKFMNPYRRDNTFDISTSSQLLMDLTNLKFEFRHDSDNSTFKGLINKLPKGYTPKIAVVIANTTDI